MGTENTFSVNFASPGKTVSTLFYIINREMFKPAEKMNIDLIDKCANIIPLIDERYAVKKEDKEAFVNKMLDIYNSDYACAEAVKPDGTKTHKKLTKKIKLILIASALAVILAGVSVLAELDLLSFTNKKSGESVVIGNEEYIYNNNVCKYNSFEELTDDLNIDIIYPKVLPSGYSVEMIVYNEYGIKSDIASVFSDLNGNVIRYVIYTDSDGWNYDGIEESSSEYIEKDGIKYYLHEVYNYYQADAVIGGNGYSVIGSIEQINDFINCLELGGD